MNCSNLKYHDISFEEYLSLDGYSYSGLKNEGATIQATSKMALGTAVHNYLLTPQHYNHENIDIVKPLAMQLKTLIGQPLMKRLIPEAAITAQFESQGFVMDYKGRIDLLVPKYLIIDIKVSELDIAKAVAHFGYDYQLSGYALATGAKLAIIVSINPKTKLTKITNIPIQSKWWEYQIIQKGKVK